MRVTHKQAGAVVIQEKIFHKIAFLIISVFFWGILAFVAPLCCYSSSVDDILDADYDALEQPLSPAVESISPAKISARLGYVWKLSDGTQAIVLLGNFSLKLPYQELSSQDAVIWLKVINKDGHRVQQLDVFMEGDARVIEKAGSVTSDNMLYVTVFTSSLVELEGNSIAQKDGSSQPIYQRAVKLRQESTSYTPVEKDKIIVRANRPARKEKPKARQPVAIKGNFTISPIPSMPGETVLIGTGGIYLIQAAEPGGDTLEIRAKNAVVFLKKEATKLERKAPKLKAIPKNLSPEQIKKQLEKIPTEEEKALKPLPMEKMKSNKYVSAAYLEGDVVISRGYRTIRADKVYYDFENSQAEIYDMVARTYQPDRNVPIYIRADYARQLNERQFVAKRAKISTNEFYTPSYHVGATTVYFEDKTERLPSGERMGLIAGTYKAYNATLNVEGVPVLYWPYVRGDFKQTETSLKSINFSYDSDFGISGETKWYLMPLLGLESPEGVDATLKLDYFGDKGPAVGIDMDYERDRYYGLMRSYYIHDTGEDNLGGDRGDVEPPYNNRGRFLIRHRQYLPHNWELTLELSYISDRNFMEEYFQNEFENGKEQETLIYLKKVFGDAVFSILGKWRINDFLTQTEELPDVAFDILGKPIFNDTVIWYSENHAGAARRKIDNDVPWWAEWVTPDNYERSEVTARGDSRQEFEVPITIGALKIVPFGIIRGSAWDDSPEGGGLTRIFGSYGLRGSLYQWRVYDDVESRFWDVHRIRHIMKEDFTVWASHTNVDSRDIYQFDEGIESIDEVDGVTIGWRNRFQTKRGPKGNRRTVDWLTLDLEAGFFNDSTSYDCRNRTRGQVFSYRPENSISSNYVSLRSIWRMSDTASLLYDAIVDTDEGRMGLSGIGLHVDRSPRLHWFVGHRYIGLTKSNLLAFGANYRLNYKYTVALREEFDLDRGENADLELSLIRKMPRWYFAITVGFDDTENVDSVSLAVWPEGAPNWTIGSRRYSRIAKFLPLD